MVLKRLSIYGLISAAAIVSGVMVGCGGSSANVSGQAPIVPASGGITSNSGSSTQTYNSVNAPQQVQVTVNGSPVNAVLPPNESLPAGANASVIPAGTPIINGASLTPPKTIGDKGAPSATYGIQGEVDVDGCAVYVTSSHKLLNDDTSLNFPLALAAGHHTITVTGPIYITGDGINGKILTVSSFVFKVTVNADGNGSIPVGLLLRLPANGGTLGGGNYATVQYPGPDFLTGSATLTLFYGNNGSVVVGKSQPVVATTVTTGGVSTTTGDATFKDLYNVHPDLYGPLTVEFDYVP